MKKKTEAFIWGTAAGTASAGLFYVLNQVGIFDPEIVQIGSPLAAAFAGAAVSTEKYFVHRTTKNAAIAGGLVSAAAVFFIHGNNLLPLAPPMQPLTPEPVAHKKVVNTPVSVTPPRVTTPIPVADNQGDDRCLARSRSRERYCAP